MTAQTFTTLHSFTYYDGAYPQAGLLLSGNTLYGTAVEGGNFDEGTVFAVNTGGTGFRNLHSFRPSYRLCISDFDCSCGFLCFDSYCMRQWFCNGDPRDTEGQNPHAGLIISGNTLYGTAKGDWDWGNGSVFSVNTAGGGFTGVHSFTGSDGAFPTAGLILSGNYLYGTANSVGSLGYGTVFAVNTAGTAFTTLHSFSGGDGAYPYAGLILSGNTLYGTASYGGSSGKGMVFALNTDGTGFTNLHSFTASSYNGSCCNTNSDGSVPYAGLVLSGNTLYGTASAGGASGQGTVFAINTDGTGFTNLHSFTALRSTNSSGFWTNSDGSIPYAGLTLLGDTLYGTAWAGGLAGHGTIFALKTDGTGFTTLHSFTAQSDGAHPYAGLILSSNALYGTASEGGGMGYGTVFGLSFRPQLGIAASGTNVFLSWPTNVAGFDYTGYTLQSAPALTGTFTNLPAGTSPYTKPIAGPQQFFRLSQ